MYHGGWEGGRRLQVLAFEGKLLTFPLVLRYHNTQLSCVPTDNRGRGMLRIRLSQTGGACCRELGDGIPTYDIRKLLYCIPAVYSAMTHLMKLRDLSARASVSTHSCSVSG